MPVAVVPYVQDRSVIPAKAEIYLLGYLDPGMRRDDVNDTLLSLGSG